jgi:hypothetical protein
MSSEKWTISLVKQVKFKLSIVPAVGLGQLLLKTIFVFIQWGSLAMSDGANPMIFWPL